MAKHPLSIAKDPSVTREVLRAGIVSLVWVALVNVLYPNQLHSWHHGFGVINKSLFADRMGWIGVVIGICSGCALTIALRTRVSALGTMLLGIALVGTLSGSTWQFIVNFSNIHFVEATVRYAVLSSLFIFVAARLAPQRTGWTALLRWRLATAIAVLVTFAIAAFPPLERVFKPALYVDHFSAAGPVHQRVAEVCDRLTVEDWVFVASLALFALAVPCLSDPQSSRQRNAIVDRRSARAGEIGPHQPP